MIDRAQQRKQGLVGRGRSRGRSRVRSRGRGSVRVRVDRGQQVRVE